MIVKAWGQLRSRDAHDRDISVSDSGASANFCKQAGIKIDLDRPKPAISILKKPGSQGKVAV